MHEVLGREAGGIPTQSQRRGVVRLGDLPHQRKAPVLFGKEDHGAIGLPHGACLRALVEKAQVAVVEEVMPRHHVDEGVIDQLRGAAALDRDAQARQHGLHVGVPKAAQVAGDRRPPAVADRGVRLPDQVFDHAGSVELPRAGERKKRQELRGGELPRVLRLLTLVREEFFTHETREVPREPQAKTSHARTQQLLASSQSNWAQELSTEREDRL
jgi:ribosomal protein L32